MVKESNDIDSKYYFSVTPGVIVALPSSRQVETLLLICSRISALISPVSPHMLTPFILKQEVRTYRKTALKTLEDGC